MQPQPGVIGWSFHVRTGTTFSFVVWLSAAQPVTATLDAVSLRDPDPGLELVGTGLLRAPLQEQYLATFPPDDIRPIAGMVVTTGLNDSTDQIVLGLRVNSTAPTLSASGVWIDYEASGQHYRMLLPWLLNVCTNPPDGPCDAPHGESFTFPPR
jgi:hypothetical protein